TTTVHSNSPMRIASRSPGPISLPGFTRSPFSLTLPPAIAVWARLRVLKKRAAHSHLSMRMRRSGERPSPITYHPSRITPLRRAIPPLQHVAGDEHAGALRRALVDAHPPEVARHRIERHFLGHPHRAERLHGMVYHFGRHLGGKHLEHGDLGPRLIPASDL